MAFEVKQWLDRIVANPTRRTLTDTTTGTSTTVDVTRAEGAVTQEGTPLAATTFNDLESRIATAFDEKQDVLTAGTNITIENNVISATGGGSGDVTKAYVDEQVSGLQYEIDYRVKKDDYAGEGKTGIVSTSTYSATYTSSGQLRANGMTLEAYNRAHDYAFVGKETLENRLAPITADVSGAKEDLTNLNTEVESIISIHSIKNGSEKTLSNATFVSMLSFKSQLSGTGLYLVSAVCTFPKPSSGSGTGARIVVISDKTSGSSVANVAYDGSDLSCSSCPANSATTTRVNVTRVIEVETEEDLNKPWAIFGYQAQGSSLSGCTASVEIIKLRDF